MTYGVYFLTTTLFIGAENNGIARATGAINAETLQRGIDILWSNRIAPLRFYILRC